MHKVFCWVTDHVLTSEESLLSLLIAQLLQSARITILADMPIPIASRAHYKTVAIAIRRPLNAIVTDRISLSTSTHRLSFHLQHSEGAAPRTIPFQRRLHFSGEDRRLGAAARPVASAALGAPGRGHYLSSRNGEASEIRLMT